MARDERNQRRMEKAYGELVEWLDVLEYRIDLIDMAQDIGPGDHPHIDLKSAVDGQIQGEHRPSGTSRIYWSIAASDLERQLTRAVNELKKVATQRWNELIHTPSEPTPTAAKFKEQIQHCWDLRERASNQLRKDLMMSEN